MDVIQSVELAGGSIRYVGDAGFLHYTDSPPHHHWHLLGYDRYTLRRVSDWSVVVRDHKQRLLPRRPLWRRAGRSATAATLPSCA